jgi:hypothetical protein
VRRRLIPILGVAVVVGGVGPVGAQSPASLPPPASEPATGAPEPAAAQQELGAAVGLAAGGRVTPGGLQADGTWLYRLSELDWFEAGIGFRVGGGAAACFRDRQDDLICDHAALQGMAAELRAGVRRYFTEQARGEFTPHAEAGVAVRLDRYGSDDLTGVAIPIWLAGGVRAVVSDGIAVGGVVRIDAGPARFGRGLGWEPQIDLAVLAGVDFTID